MRKVINGRTYNTAASKLIGRWDNGHYTNDFEYCSEGLGFNIDPDLYWKIVALAMGYIFGEAAVDIARAKAQE